MVKKWLLLIGMIIATVAIVIILAPGKASAATSDEDAYGEVWMNTFYAHTQWTYTSSDTIDINLFYNDIKVASNNGNYGSSGTDSGTVSYSPVKAGSYKVQLWSSRDNKEVYSKDWVVPNLQINLTVSPVQGEIGTTLVATTTFSTTTNGPEDYSFSGTLELNAGGSIFRQNIGADIYSPHYYDYYKISDYNIKPIFTATGFTFPLKGKYVISAQYSDSLSLINASPITIEIQDQYEPEIQQLSSELQSTHAELNQTKAQLATTNINLNATNDLLGQTKKDLSDQIQTSIQYAYIGIAIGLVGIIIGFVGVMMARRIKVQQHVQAQMMSQPMTPPGPPVQYHQQPVSPPPTLPQQAPPIPPQLPQPSAQQPQAPPPIIHQNVPPSPMAVQSAPSGGICAKCGTPLTPGMKFCGNCGAPR